MSIVIIVSDMKSVQHSVFSCDACRKPKVLDVIAWYTVDAVECGWWRR